jgi:4-hydroxy-tetrahydrodipicolinate synthase
MKYGKFEGAMTALVTPFDADGNVDVPSLQKIVEKQIENGIDGLVACGTTGETPTLSPVEQERVIKTVVEVAGGRVPVIAGTGSNNTRATVERTKEVSAWGVDGALVVVPYYNKPDQEGIYRHYKTVAEDGGLPVVAYNVPGRTVADMMPETIARLQHERLIAAVKEATANMIRATATLELLDPDVPFSMMTGDDFTTMPFIAVGGVGAISVTANIAPGDASRLVKLTREAKMDEARALHGLFMTLTQTLFAAPNPVPVKAALALAGWCRPDVRLPLATASEELTARVRAALTRYAGYEDLAGYMS